MVNFESGKLIEGAYCIVNGEKIPVHMPVYKGNTPASPENLNKMQKDLEDLINVAKLSLKKQIIAKEYSSNVTIPANGNSVVNFGAIEVIDGYTAIGVINKETGYGDQFSMSCGFYGGNIIAKIVNHFGNELTNTVSCNVIYLKD